MSRGRIVGFALLCVVLGAGCAGPRYGYEDLPERPIAIVYRTLAESDQVFDQVLKNEELLERQRTLRGRRKSVIERSTLDGDDIASVLGIGSREERIAATLGRIALVAPRTGEVTPVDWAPRGARPTAWSEDGTRLLYLSLRRKKPHVYERDFATGDVRQISHDDQAYVDASYCGPGGIVMAARGSSGRVDLLLRRDGEGTARRLTEVPFAYAPACLPDGSKVIFETLDDAGAFALASLDLTTPDAEPVVLTRGSHPAVTPDGEWVVYSVKRRSGFKLWRMRTDGSGRHPLGRSGNWEHAPDVSPDGRFVLFYSTKGKRQVRQELWIRPLDGDDDRPVRVRGDALHPTW